MTTVEEFRKFGKAMVDYVADYMENVRDKDVLPDVQPGYLQPLLPKEAPEEPEDWRDLMKDIEKHIMPGTTHWRHPNFYAYFASGQSAPSIVADILSAAIGCVGFSWIASPACTELEMITMDWLAKLLKLPEHFLFSSKGKGGGILQPTASEATLISVLTARSNYIKKDKIKSNNFEKLIIYASKQSHSSVERAAMLAGVRIRFLDTENLSLRGEALRNAIREDKSKGLIPLHCTATLGTTNSCAFDNLYEIGEVCKEESIWLHIDAAYAGSAFICDEFQCYLKGIEFADSFNFNLHKWMLTNFDCSAFWIKNSSELVDAFNVDPLYLKHNNEGKIPDYRHWQIPLGRRFKSLKVWFVLRLFGKEGIQKHIRKHVRLAKEFEALVLKDERFEISAPVIMGLVCFRLKGDNHLSEELLKKIIEERKLYLVSTNLNGKYVLRFAIVTETTTSDDIKAAFKTISSYATNILLANQQANIQQIAKTE